MTHEAAFDLWRAAEQIPDLGGGGSTIAPTLVQLSSEVSRNRVIVDIAPFLGSTTAWLALGSAAFGSDAPIHSFDRWEVEPDLRKRAWKHARVELPESGSFWQLWAQNVANLPIEITPHKGDVYAGEIYDGAEIGLLVDDCTSGVYNLELLWSRFGRRIAHGAPIVMMDYYFIRTHAHRREIRETVDWFKAREDLFDGPYPVQGRRNTAAVFYFTGRPV